MGWEEGVKTRILITIRATESRLLLLAVLITEVDKHRHGGWCCPGDNRSLP